LPLVAVINGVLPYQQRLQLVSCVHIGGVAVEGTGICIANLREFSYRLISVNVDVNSLIAM
jgi:hypothetical protein